MLKRRSTLENQQKSKRHKITEYLLELDRCIQIPNDSKLIIRKKIKENQEEIINLFDAHRRDKNYHELQIKLRKIIQNQKNQQKRFTIHHGQRKKSEYNQRVYSQNSQNGSFKNSIKASPQREDGKRAMIVFDICELKKKMEQCQRDNKSTYQIADSKSKSQMRINSIGRINTSLNKSRQSSFDKLPLKDHKQSYSYTNKGSMGGKPFPTKITLKINDKKSPNKQKQNSYNNQYCRQEKGGVNDNISYSSSIKNLLLSKLKDQKDLKRQKVILKQNKNREECISSNRTITGIHEQTVMKKSAKPMVRDQITLSPQKIEQTYERFPMYIQTTSHIEENQQKTHKKIQEFSYDKNKHKNGAIKYEKLETLNTSSQEKYGQFYLKIKDIINNKNY